MSRFFARSIKVARARAVTVSASVLFGSLVWKGMTTASAVQNAMITEVTSASESCAAVIEALLFENRKAYALAAVVAFVLIIAGVVIERLRADLEARDE